ncbi:MAG: hypothetical protein ACE145_04545 [Terriglobia bacterium]
MRKLLMLLAIMAFAGFAMAQTYTEGSGITGIDKLGAHQNGGRGCVGCHAPHSGAYGNGGNAAAGGAVSGPEAGNLALWGQDLGPLYGQLLTFAGETEFDLPSLGVGGLGGLSPEQEEEVLGVMTCLSCHDGNIAKGAMMTNQSYEQSMGLLPAGYGTRAIPTLLGLDGTGNGNYKNDHPIGPNANLGAVGVASKLEWVVGGCGSTTSPSDCILPKTSNNAQFLAFYNHYGAFNITGKGRTNYYSGGRANVVTVGTDVTKAYLVCTTCHTPHTMYTFSGSVKNVPVPSGETRTYPSYFFISAPYNPGAPVTAGKASSATQFCRQCHFSGAGGSNESAGILGVDTQF